MHAAALELVVLEGGDAKCAVTSPAFDSSTCMAVGCAMLTVRWSSWLQFASPNACADASCSVVACEDTLTPATAMRSCSVKSLIDLMPGLRALSSIGMEFSAATPCTPSEPRVRSHSVTNEPRPPAA